MAFANITVNVVGGRLSISRMSNFTCAISVLWWWNQTLKFVSSKYDISYNSVLNINFSCFTKDVFFTCESCKQQFNIELFKEHQSCCSKRNVNLDDLLYVCEFCFQIFETEALLKQHRSSQNCFHFETKVYKCDFCDFSTEVIANLILHIEIEHSTNLYSCDCCFAQYLLKFQLLHHWHVLHFSFRFMCELCNRTFDDEDTYNTHMKSKIHTEIDDIKPFSDCLWCLCEICGDVFQDGSCLLEHLQLHKEYGICDITDKKELLNREIHFDPDIFYELLENPSELALWKLAIKNL